MVERRTIALSYTYNKNWIGGTYYIENLINALNTLNEEVKPNLIVMINNHSDKKNAENKLNYPYLKFQLASGEKNRLFQAINKITGRLFNKKIFSQHISGLDVVFPYYPCIQQSLASRKIFWIPDFQEHFAPQYFSPVYLEERRKNLLSIQESTENLIVSSRNALSHFKSLFPNHIVKVSVLPFAVTHEPFGKINLPKLLKKYNLPEQYFVCPNQFWKHKNQFVVLNAVNELKNRGVNVIVAFTGNTSDYRNPVYFTELKDFVNRNGLEHQIRFLGFIDRREQLQLMRNSIAIIQPSFFEGWSTVVEDAKAMNKFLIVSNIAVHKEQLENSNARFFNPKNPTKLASAMEQCQKLGTLPTLFEINNYGEKVCEFALNFLEIVSRSD